MQPLPKEGFLGKPRDKERDKMRTLEEFEASDTIIANVKHHQSPSQINTEPHANGLFISLSTTGIMSGFQKTNYKAG